jgi:hypothetical protein
LKFPADFIKSESPKKGNRTQADEHILDRRVLLCAFVKLLHTEAAQLAYESQPQESARRRGRPPLRTQYDPDRCKDYPIYEAFQLFMTHIVPKDLPVHEGLEMINIDLGTQVCNTYKP